ncbi:MAG: cytochrome c oxidase accessory protein CcoG [Fibrobacteres bacterium]|nr:cytochrome c oxidase accessory protein CcoG [Fibrobacterota bacterium]
MIAEPPASGLPPEPGGGRIGETQGTIGEGGLRLWLYPREVTGRFTRSRHKVAWALMILYLGLPWLHWRGDSLVRVDWYGRKVIALGHAFWVQDIPIFLPAFFSFVLLAFLGTARLGRIWCGWACPQTVFLQFLFAPIEKAIEGKSSVRKARDAGPADFAWLWRKVAKHAAFALVAAWIANSALAYFWGTRNLLYAMAHPSAENWPGLALVIAFAAVFYYVFAFFREQACILICPYARFQSVLVDEDTSVIAYDSARGERRGKGPRGSREGLGDCTDCRQCVLVCPTGIDIRMGQQLECIGCARCIDACDRTMTAWKKPVGLVRYASLRDLQGKPRSGKPWRLFAYAALALIMASASAILLARRPAVAHDLLRRGQSPYVRVGADSVLNTFTLHLRNNGSERLILMLGWDGAARGTSNWEGRSFALASGQSLDLPVDLTTPASGFIRGGADAGLVLSAPGVREEIDIRLAGPWGR